jgi:hypothetical protein
MSAYVVNKRHIDALVTGGLEEMRRSRSSSFRWYQDDQPAAELTWDQADAVGQMLWTENILSVEYRYPDLKGFADNENSLPGPIGLDRDEAYTFQPLNEPLSAVELLKALHCYEYQSCEHPAWATSSAKAFAEALERATMRRLPGYDDANWEVASDRPVRSIYTSILGNRG